MEMRVLTVASLARKMGVPLSPKHLALAQDMLFVEAQAIVRAVARQDATLPPQSDIKDLTPADMLATTMDLSPPSPPVTSPTHARPPPTRGRRGWAS